MRWVVLLVAAGCIEPSLVPCNDELCPIGHVCTPGGCATEAEVLACMEQPAGQACAAGDISRGACRDGACREVVCGDNLMELDEVCDDGDVDAGNGCNATCTSTEQCGNAYVDLDQGEQCDSGIAGLSADGCSSSCQLEGGAWTEVFPPTISARAEFSMSNDGERMILFGGAISSGPLADTWSWDGAQWSPVDPVTSPPARRGAAIAYDVVRAQTILFGGLGSQGPLADTWRWDGRTWEELHPATSPSPRFDAAMSYDFVTQTLVMHGGVANETWVWNGTNWSNQTKPFSPDHQAIPHPALTATAQGLVLYGAPDDDVNGVTHLMGANYVFTDLQIPPDPSVIDGVHLASDYSGQVVMFGGYNAARQIDGTTYVLPNLQSTWTKDTGVPSPPPRVKAGFASGATGGGAILFGGLAVDGSLLRDTWIYSNGDWSLAQAIPEQPSLGDSACAYDTERGRTVVWNGTTGETWVHAEPAGWKMIGPAPNASFGPEHAIAYDSLRDRVVLFGTNGSIGGGETWELDDPSTKFTDPAPVWNLISTSTAPSDRTGHMMTFDLARGEVVLFGGANDATTWTYKSGSWTPHIVPGPPARRWGALAYDAHRERVVLYGGYSTTDLGDTWEWDGTSWTNKTPMDSPAGRHRHTLVYDPARQRTVLVGGENATGLSTGTWEWDGASWVRIPLAESAPARSGHCATYDEVGRRVFLFGGTNFLGSRVREVWMLRYDDPRRRTERCRVATEDADGDGLAGCADPDCWGRCTPLCPPGAPCPATASRCGDGRCAVVEDHDLCPVDCS